MGELIILTLKVMSVYKYSNFYVPRPTATKQSDTQNIAEENHCNIARLKIKEVLKKSKQKSKHMFETALRQSNSNIPLASIDLTNQNKRSVSIASLEKCRSELSLQKQILLKELQNKEQKVEALRQTFRNIQSSKQKLVLKRDERQDKLAQNKRNTDNQSENRFTMREREDFRESMGTPNLALDLIQRTRLFPSNARQA